MPYLPAPIRPDYSLNQRTKQCLKDFETLLDGIKKMPEKKTPGTNWIHEHYRFSMWAATTGVKIADPQDKDSLDHDLQHREHIKQVFESLLEELNTTLIAAGDATSYQAPILTREDEKVTAEERDYRIWRAGPFHVEATELECHYGRVCATIDALNASIALLRTPTELAWKHCWGRRSEEIENAWMERRKKMSGGSEPVISE